MYKNQIEIETAFNKQQINQWIINEVLESATNTKQYKACAPLITKYLSQNYYDSKNKRLQEAFSNVTIPEVITLIFASVLPITTPTTATAPIQAVATQLGLHLHSSQIDAVKTGAELLAVCESVGLYTILSYHDPLNNEDSAVIKPNYQLSEELQFKIHSCQYLPPMLCEPIPWTSNTKGGLLTQQSSCILGSGNNIGQAQALDVLNKLQSIEWELNLDTLQEQEPEAKPQKPSESNSEYTRRVKQHNIATEQSARIYDLMLENNNSFYFIWKYDKRGRMYSQGYDINLQGSEYKKSILNFKHSEPLTK